MAGEIEFYLYTKPSHSEHKVEQTQCFDVDAPKRYQTVLENIEIEAKNKISRSRPLLQRVHRVNSKLTCNIVPIS
jgi:hypothetical protein